MSKRPTNLGEVPQRDRWRVLRCSHVALSLPNHAAAQTRPRYPNQLPPNCHRRRAARSGRALTTRLHESGRPGSNRRRPRSEEHTSELQSLTNLVCRLLLEKKKKKKNKKTANNESHKMK